MKKKTNKKTQKKKNKKKTTTTTTTKTKKNQPNYLEMHAANMYNAQIYSVVLRLIYD
jgi:hypothetical protein